MWKKLVGVASGALALGSAMFTAMAITDLIGGNSGTETGVLVGLLVFFGGLTAATGYGALRLLRDAPPPPATTSATAATAGAAQATAASTPAGPGVDIALEARILAYASQRAGRVTAAEIAVACGVPIDVASAALDGLAVRGHADLQVSPDGATVYVIAGFLSQEEKERAEAIVTSRA